MAQRGPYRTISDQTGVSTGKISDIITKEFLPALGDRFVAEYLKQLIIEVKNEGITIKQCAVGLRISRLLQDLGISTNDKLENLESFLSEIYGGYTRLVASQGRSGLSPQQIMELAGQLLEISLKNENITPAEIPKYVESKIEEKKQLDNKIEILRKERESAKNQLEELLEKQQVTSANLEQYVFLKVELKKHGLTVNDGDGIQEIVNAINNAHQLQYNVTKILNEISELESLKDRKTKLEDENKRLDEQIHELKGERDSLQRWIDTFSLTVDKIKELDSMGFTQNELAKLSHVIYGIANTRSGTSSYTTQEAMSKFFKDVEEQYSKVLSFEEKLKELQHQIDKKGSDLYELQVTYANEKSVLDAFKALFDRNVTEKDILNWTSILKRYNGDESRSGGSKSSINTKTLAQDLETYGGMKETISKLTYEIEDRESQIECMAAEIKALEIQKEGLEKQ